MGQLYKFLALHISLGDANSRFFYNAIAVRNTRNGIHTINSLQGRLTSPKDIDDEAIRFFKEAVNPTNHVVCPKVVQFHSRLSDYDRRLLDADYTDSEVKRAVMEAQPEKALGPDGFLAIFFQKF